MTDKGSKTDRSEPSLWVKRYAGLIPAGGTVLDIACGNGRHARYLAALGHRVIATDIDGSALENMSALENIETIEIDLENAEWPFRGTYFDSIVAVNYLHRPLLPALRDALADGGVMIYDTFAAGNEQFGRPHNPDYLLRPGELIEIFHGALNIIAYEHGIEHQPRPAVRQRICAVKANGPVVLPGG